MFGVDMDSRDTTELIKTAQDISEDEIKLQINKDIDSNLSKDSNPFKIYMTLHENICSRGELHEVMKSRGILSVAELFCVLAKEEYTKLKEKNNEV